MSVIILYGLNNQGKVLFSSPLVCEYHENSELPVSLAGHSCICRFENDFGTQSRMEGLFTSVSKISPDLYLFIFWLEVSG